MPSRCKNRGPCCVPPGEEGPRNPPRPPMGLTKRLRSCAGWTTRTWSATSTQCKLRWRTLLGQASQARRSAASCSSERKKARAYLQQLGGMAAASTPGLRGALAAKRGAASRLQASLSSPATRRRFRPGPLWHPTLPVMTLGCARLAPFRAQDGGLGFPPEHGVHNGALSRATDCRRRRMHALRTELHPRAGHRASRHQGEQMQRWCLRVERGKRAAPATIAPRAAIPQLSVTSHAAHLASTARLPAPICWYALCRTQTFL